MHWPKSIKIPHIIWGDEILKYLSKLTPLNTEYFPDKDQSDTPGVYDIHNGRILVYNAGDKEFRWEPNDVGSQIT